MKAALALLALAQPTAALVPSSSHGSPQHAVQPARVATADLFESEGGLDTMSKRTRKPRRRVAQIDEPLDLLSSRTRRPKRSRAPRGENLSRRQRACRGGAAAGRKKTDGRR